MKAGKAFRAVGSRVDPAVVKVARVADGQADLGAARVEGSKVARVASPAVVAKAGRVEASKGARVASPEVAAKAGRVEGSEAAKGAEADRVALVEDRVEEVSRADPEGGTARRCGAGTALTAASARLPHRDPDHRPSEGTALP